MKTPLVVLLCLASAFAGGYFGRCVIPQSHSANPPDGSATNITAVAESHKSNDSTEIFKPSLNSLNSFANSFSVLFKEYFENDDRKADIKYPSLKVEGRSHRVEIISTDIKRTDSEISPYVGELILSHFIKPSLITHTYIFTLTQTKGGEWKAVRVICKDKQGDSILNPDNYTALIRSAQKI